MAKFQLILKYLVTIWSLQFMHMQRYHSILCVREAHLREHRGECAPYIFASFHLAAMSLNVCRLHLIYALPAVGNAVNATTMVIITSNSEDSERGQNVTCPQGRFFILPEGCRRESNKRQTNETARTFVPRSQYISRSREDPVHIGGTSVFLSRVYPCHTLLLAPCGDSVL